VENNEEENHNDERIDTNQLLVFCSSLLGLYKGEDTISIGQNSVVNNEQKHELIVNTNPNTTDINTQETNTNNNNNNNINSGSKKK